MSGVEQERAKDIVQRALRSLKSAAEPHEQIRAKLQGIPVPKSLVLAIWDASGYNNEAALDALELAQSKVGDLFGNKELIDYLLALREACVAYRRTFNDPTNFAVSYNPQDLLATEFGLMQAYHAFINMKVGLARPTARYGRLETSGEIRPPGGQISTTIGQAPALPPHQTSPSAAVASSSSRQQSPPSPPPRPTAQEAASSEDSAPHERPAKRGRILSFDAEAAAEKTVKQPELVKKAVNRRLFEDEDAEKVEQQHVKRGRISEEEEEPELPEPVIFTDVKYGADASMRETDLHIIGDLMHLLAQRKAMRSGPSGSLGTSPTSSGSDSGPRLG